MEYDDIFYKNVLELLREAADALSSKAKTVYSQAAVNVAFRSFHSIKGGASMVGLQELEPMLHRLENILTEVHNGNLQFDTQVIKLLLDAISILEIEVVSAMQGIQLEPFEKRQEKLLRRINEINPAGEEKKIDLPLPELPSKNRLFFLYFVLFPEAPMPEVSAVVLEQQYQEAGNLISMSLAKDGDRQVVVGCLETEMGQEQLKRLCKAADIEHIRIHPFSQYVTLESDVPKIRMRVLLLEDNVALLLLLQTVLQKKGYDTTVVKSAEEALPLIETESYHVLITDVQLPGIDGLEFARQAKKRFSLLQIIVITGETKISKATEALAIGASEYLLKPLDMVELITAVEHCQQRLMRWWERLNSLTTR